MPTLLRYLEAAAAHPELKSDILAFLQGGAGTRVQFEGHAPRIKVERVLTQLFHEHPELQVEKLRLTGRSGCSDFVGSVIAITPDSEHHFEFTWCCAWRAEQEGWRDCFGFWDQARAAREFGWRCFSRWQQVS